MSYQTTEESINSGKPIELFDFVFGQTHYRYTSGPIDIVYNTKTYVSETIQRDDLELTENAFKNEIKLTLNRENIFGRLFISSVLEGIVTLTIYRGHGSDFVTYWNGILSHIKYNSDGIEISASPKTSTMGLVGLRRKYQKLCTHHLYGPGCLAASSSFKSTGIIATIDNFTITSAVFATKADGYFISGKFIVGDARRLITTHVGSTITINRRMVGVIASNNFSAFAGCAHTMDACRLVFDNLDNYGGQPWIPIKNPFSGDAII